MYVLTEDEYNRLKIGTIRHTEPVPFEIQNTNENTNITSIEKNDQAKVAVVEEAKDHKVFKCQVCGKVYTNKRDRRRHIQKTHPQPSAVHIHSVSPIKVEPTVKEKKVAVKSTKARKRKHNVTAFDNIPKWRTLND